MTTHSQPEVWLRGPLADIPPLLQPVAHGLMQCREELLATLHDLTAQETWMRPANVAAIGYHARHAMGSLDRLFTYARGEALSHAQLSVLTAESREDDASDIVVRLTAEVEGGVERALAQLRATSEATLIDARYVGRARLPSTVIGLLFHAAEHTQRHSGQAVTTKKIIRGTQA